ncbi:MAG: hypothetical protein CMH56_00045 [Myxococcales bacterium]|nr:hypothetical protein [Myxococcales bacterium]|tara:strand:+ start:586 stop:1212 length:627 start_codon:yes stop_codon:yes gene_type:complete
MTQVFTKKHKKSSCLAPFLLFLALTAPSFAQETTKELSGAPNHLLNKDKKSETLGLPVGLFGVYHQRQPAHLKAKNDAQLQELLDSLAFYIRPFAEPRLERLFKSFKVIEIKSDTRQLGIKVDTFDNFVWTPVDGRWQEFKNTPRGDFKLRRWVKNGILHSEANQNGPIKQNRYYLSDDGQTLRLEVTVTSEYLPRPLELAYRYQRVK